MGQISAWATEILNSDAVILDTETTGGAKTDQIIQLSIVDMSGKALFDSLLRPTCEINPMASQVHHLTKNHLRNAPSFSDVHEVVKSVLNGRTVIAYNYSFDKRMLKQTVEAFKFDSSWVEKLNWQCAMRAHAEHLGVKNAPKLEGGDHSALGDCLATLKLLKSISGVDTRKEADIRKEEITSKIPVGATGHELLAYLSPPIELLEHLERYQAKGQLPQAITDWVQRWNDIRGDGPSQIDGTSPNKWAEVGRMVNREKVAA